MVQVSVVETSAYSLDLRFYDSKLLSLGQRAWGFKRRVIAQTI